uniref:mitogen-activated protein kinase kinase kinase n=1 Tax=Daucus carota subsp. sativus TaxID=79200 RepID=A0A161ZMJ9_DAUCS
MQDFIGSVRRSLVFTSSGGGEEPNTLGGLVGKIGSSIRRSRIGLFPRPMPPALPPIVKAKRDDESSIRWRKGELIGSGAFGQVYMGMNLDSGELLAVKQVSIAANSASKEKTQAHVRELEDEVKLLKNLSHPNIVRYLGTAREEHSLNILLEFVPGGSISSLLGKFGSFPESVLRMYTKQLLLGLEYLHKNGIMHRDIKGANILVDNKGCIKLADFGASKKVVELATMTGAKSMKGTPYWMAPEVILQTGHSFSADIWSVGCTVIEMATGKPPWSQQYQEVAALFHIGTTKSHPPIPDHLSAEAKDFLLKCLHKEPDWRPTASDLLQHPFVTGEYQESLPVNRTSVICFNTQRDHSGKHMDVSKAKLKNSINPGNRLSGIGSSDMGNVRCSTVYPENLLGDAPNWGSSNYDDDMCQLDDEEDFFSDALIKRSSTSLSADVNKSFNPMSEPNDDWQCKFDDSPVLEKNATNILPSETTNKHSVRFGSYGNGDDFTFPSGTLTTDDEDEVTESKIIAFLDEKALVLKKLQSPLYEEFYNSLNPMCSISAVRTENKENLAYNCNLPPKSRSPNRAPSRRFSAAVDVAYTASPENRSKHVSVGSSSHQAVQEPKSPPYEEMKVDPNQEPVSLSASFSERQRKWKEELNEELERKREMMRQAGVATTSSPKDRIFSRQKDRFRFAFPVK